MTDVVLYARHATRESIERQLHLCRECAAQDNGNIVGTYQDEGSGNLDLSLRPGLRALLEDAAGHKFDTVLVEDLCRLSRDPTNLASFLKKFWSLGIRVLTVNDGEITPLHIEMKGTMGQLFLENLARNVRRSRARGDRKINDAEARIIRRVFCEYAAGVSPHAIAKRLNDEGISPPRGRR